MLVNSQRIDHSECILTSDAASDVAFLQKENEYLKKLIEEKERLIKVLLAGHYVNALVIYSASAIFVVLLIAVIYLAIYDETFVERLHTHDNTDWDS